MCVVYVCVWPDQAIYIYLYTCIYLEGFKLLQLLHVLALSTNSYVHMQFKYMYARTMLLISQLLISHGNRNYWLHDEQVH